MLAKNGYYTRKIKIRIFMTKKAFTEKLISNLTLIRYYVVDLGGLGVTCSPRDPWFAGSNPAEVMHSFQDVKIQSTSPPGRTLSYGSRV